MKKKVYVLAGLLFLAAILFMLTFAETEPEQTLCQEVSLRADTKDLSIDDMINTVEKRKTPTSEEVAPGFVGSYATSESTTPIIISDDDPDAVAKVQALIRANEDNIELGAQQIEAERQGQVITTSDYIPARKRTVEMLRSKEKPKEKVILAKVDSSEIASEEPVKEEPAKRSPFNSIRLITSSNKNAIKAYVHSEQVVMAGSTLKMRLGEDAYTDNGVLIPKNSPVFGAVTSIDGERVNVRITHINLQGNILPFEKEVYSKDALLGIYVPGNPKSEVTKDAAGGALDGLPTSGIPGVDAAAQIAGVVASSAANAGKQAISKNVKKIKVTIETNYEIYLRPDEKK